MIPLTPLLLIKEVPMTAVNDALVEVFRRIIKHEIQDELDARGSSNDLTDDQKEQIKSVVREVLDYDVSFDVTIHT
jgi:hypothetical protein